MKRLVYIFSILLAVAVSCTEKETVAEVTLEYAAGQAAEVVAAPQGESITLGFVASDVWDVTTVAESAEKFQSRRNGHNQTQMDKSRMVILSDQHQTVGRQIQDGFRAA